MTKTQKRVSLMALLIFVLSFIDGGLTLLIVEKGAIEANPVMNYFLSFGHIPFMLAKFIFGYIFVFTMIYFSNKYKKVVISSLLISFSVYSVIICYHFFLRSLL